MVEKVAKKQRDMEPPEIRQNQHHTWQAQVVVDTGEERGAIWDPITGQEEAGGDRTTTHNM